LFTHSLLVESEVVLSSWKIGSVGSNRGISQFSKDW